MAGEGGIGRYQQEHLEAFEQVRDHLRRRPDAAGRLRAMSAGYLDFRRRLADFQRRTVGGLCRRKCFENRLSACCSREGSVVFFADVVVECLLSGNEAAGGIVAALRRPNPADRCVYLTEAGCRWQMPPVVCAMFLCEEAEAAVVAAPGRAADRWEALGRERRRYTWPDRPVLFDAVEQLFLAAGIHSALMYLNTSAGLLAVKRKAGLPAPAAAARR